MNKGSVSETGAGLLPLALCAPLLSVVHAVDFAAFFVLPPYSAWGNGHFWTVWAWRQLKKLVWTLWDRSGPEQKGLSHVAYQLALVVGILVRWTGHVAVRQGWWGTGRSEFDFGVVEFFFLW